MPRYYYWFFLILLLAGCASMKNNNGEVTDASYYRISTYLETKDNSTALY